MSNSALEEGIASEVEIVAVCGETKLSHFERNL